MDKAEGVPLSQLWDKMKLPQKLQVLLAMIRLQKQWLNVSFSHYSSLYYAKDVQSPRGNHYVKAGETVTNSNLLLVRLQAAIGLMLADQPWKLREDRVRLDLHTFIQPADRSAGPSITQYLQAISMRETKAIKSLSPPKHIALFCGPKLYQLDMEKKRTSLARYQQIVDALIPKNPAITKPYIWHNDLHDDNIFVDPQNPEKITGIIDCQPCHVSPLFNHNPEPAFLDWDSLEPKTLDLVPKPKLSGLSLGERSAAVR